MIQIAPVECTRISRLPYSSQDEPLPKEHQTRSVLFVCWANVCRSPAGKSVMNKFLKARNLQSRFFIDSAGVAAKDRELRPSGWMRWTAFRRGYRLKGRPRRIMRMDLDRFDLVIAMDHRVLFSLRSVHSNPQSRIRLLGDFLPSNEPLDVPDPMNRGADRCNLVFDMLEAACSNIIHEMCTTIESENCPTNQKQAGKTDRNHWPLTPHRNDPVALPTGSAANGWT